jgi:hypothetical protein
LYRTNAKPLESPVLRATDKQNLRKQNRHRSTSPKIETEASPPVPRDEDVDDLAVALEERVEVVGRGACEAGEYEYEKEAIRERERARSRGGGAELERLGLGLAHGS